ncbi:cobalt-precorrin 5B C1-methyltransferase [Hydrogenispora ethanolica]|uniref:Cobalt-precorrin-5B C(1)-methyltransferase n=1 Tax=Hydrogenispora ethanolica TaxID=1082276 RepID=A0A4R1S4N6_HYDET|nr:cobalt-precorrin-5B (C(1))-methyltransferase CbiD [Hydrogenispora ethanolica]TCL74069.1 cobalt-precorrin 5B C1-methyltransferase [Hydrogenispora ethanolica]
MNGLRQGFTTGTAAAAAVKAALLCMAGEENHTVEVSLLQGGKLEIPVQSCGRVDSDPGAYYGEIVKDAGDDPDVTHGLLIRAEIRRLPGTAVVLNGGAGVGRVTKPGLPVPPGEPAINPVPRRMILQAVDETPIRQGLEITIIVPRGAEVAPRTLNPRLGIVGGISILGTTGIVKPVSEEAWRDSLVPQLNVIAAAGHDTALLTPGRQGLNWALQRGIPEEQIAETSNFIGFMLEQSQKAGFRQVILWGHYGKLLKVAAGVFKTHNRVADARLETLIAISALLGAAPELLRRIDSANTTEEAVQQLTAAGLDRPVLDAAAERASRKAGERYGIPAVGTVLLDRNGVIRGSDRNAERIMRERRWTPTGS